MSEDDEVLVFLFFRDSDLLLWLPLSLRVLTEPPLELRSVSDLQLPSRFMLAPLVADASIFPALIPDKVTPAPLVAVISESPPLKADI